MSKPDARALAELPRVDHVLADPAMTELGLRRSVARAAVRETLAAMRDEVQAGRSIEPSLPAVVAATVSRARAWLRPSPQPVVNATGVLLHTNLGRAPLSAEAVNAMVSATGTCDLEIDMQSGARGSRFAALRPLMRVAFKADDAHVVTNGAAALLLACTALGRSADSKREGVVLCRAQMIEIGDGFRIATMAAAGGVPVIEVGATNRSHLADYEAALEAGAAAILWAHASNFEQRGFTKQPGLEALSQLARAHEVPLIADLGSGSMGAELPSDEPTVQAYIAAGADLVTFSGDKLLGGPQAGVMAGRAALVEACRRFPMARALRPGKTVLAALHATLAAHAREGETQLPLHWMLRATQAQLRGRAESMLASLKAIAGFRFEIVESVATIGGGALPGDERASIAISIQPPSAPNKGAPRDAAQIAAALRLASPPVVGRVEKERMLLDLRSVPPNFDAALVGALRAALA